MPPERDAEVVVGDPEQHGAPVPAVRRVLCEIDRGQEVAVVDRAVADADVRHKVLRERGVDVQEVREPEEMSYGDESCMVRDGA